MRASVGLALVLTFACGAPPPPPAPRPLEPPPEAEAAPVAAPFECPELETDASHAREADALRRAFAAVARGERVPDDVHLHTPGAESPLLARAQEARACPVRYDPPRWPDDGLVTFDDPAIGTLPIDVEWSGRESRARISLTAAEQAFELRSATRRLASALDADPSARAVHASTGEAILVALAHEGGVDLCLYELHGHEGDALPAARCFRAAGAVTRLGVLSRVEPPYRDDEAEDAVHEHRTFVDVEGVLYALEDGSLAPVELRPRSEDRAALALAGEPPPAPAARALEPFDPGASSVFADIVRLSPDPIGPRCFRGDMALCCRHDERWRCADVGTALRVRDVDASSLVISPAGEITFVDRFCDGGSELTECNRVRHFMHADGASLVSDGSISVGFGWDEHERDVGERGTSVHGETRDLLWEHEVRGHACVEVRGARLTTGTYSAFYPARGRPRRRQRTARPAPVYGERVDLLPRFAPFEAPREREGGAIPDLRGVFRLEGGTWRRVDRCP